MSEDTTETPLTSARPRWSANESARRCRVGRTTIQRALDDGRIPGAIRTEKGWSIGVDDLLAAGFHPDRPAPAPDITTPAREPDRADLERAAHLARIHELELALARAEVRREAAEQVAAERAHRVEDLRRTLAMIEGRPESAPSPTLPAEQPASRVTGRTGLLGRLWSAAVD